MNDRDWTIALDALETLLDRQRAFVAGEGPMPDTPWESPEGELPEGVRVRALTLAAACEDIETQLRRLLYARTDQVASPYR